MPLPLAQVHGDIAGAQVRPVERVFSHCEEPEFGLASNKIVDAHPLTVTEIVLVKSSVAHPNRSPHS